MDFVKNVMNYPVEPGGSKIFLFFLQKSAKTA
jgi:hypothetical protein